MNDYSRKIKRDINEFQKSVKTLSQSIGQAGNLWSDPKFKELSGIVGEVANNSKEILMAGDRCCSILDKFNKISAEKY